MTRLKHGGALGRMAVTVTILLATSAVARPAVAQGLRDPDEAYFRRFEGQARHLLVLEYVDEASRGVTGQRVFRSDIPFRPTATLAGQGPRIPLVGLTVALYGIQSCPSNKPIEVAVYEGPCSGALAEYLTGELKAAPVTICRALQSEQAKPVQSVTCWNQYKLGPVDLINMTEAALLETGAAILERNAKGEALRPELQPHEDKARGKGSIIWNPRAQAVLRGGAP